MNSKTEVEVEEPRKRAEGTVYVSVSAFPTGQWDEWDKDCKERFGDCRWLKMWNDHQRARDYDFYQSVITRIEKLEKEELK